MIHELRGDILLSGAHALAHGVAPNDHFDSGLALALRERWPAMVKDFRHYCHTSQAKPGDLWAWGGADGKRIVSLFTQNPAAHEHARPGKASTENVNHALRALRRTVLDEGFTSLAMPRLATGVGGLEWADVKPLIEHHLGDLAIPVYVYSQYHAGVAATEPGV